MNIRSTRSSRKTRGAVDVDRTPTHNTHLCRTVCSQARNAHHALGSSHTDCSVIFVRLKRLCHLVRTRLTLCCFRTCFVPRAHLLPHSLFLLPRHQNTDCHRDNTIHSKNTQCIINLSKHARSKSIKNHTCVRTSRVTETCATPSPQLKAVRRNVESASSKNKLIEEKAIRKAGALGVRSRRRRPASRFARPMTLSKNQRGSFSVRVQDSGDRNPAAMICAAVSGVDLRHWRISDHLVSRL